MEVSTITLEYVRCVLCEQDDAQIVLTAQDWLHNLPGEFRVVRCGQCGMVYLNPRPTRADMLRFYPADYAYAPDVTTQHQKESWRARLHRAILIRDYGYPLPQPALPRWSNPIVAAYHALYQTIALPILLWRPSGRLLDVGCGKGDYLAAQRDLGWQVVGVEINPHAVRHARDVLNLEILDSDLADAPLAENSFDATTMWWYLEHVPDPLQVLRHARRLIKPDGVLVIGVPNWDSVDVKIFRDAWYHLDVPRHQSFFTPTTLTAMLRRAGFQTISLRGSSWLNDPAQSVERWLAIRRNKRWTMPGLVRKLLTPLGWLAGRSNRGSVMYALAYPHADNG
ncbi:MAG: class I SAM-dependent methyltransferase [Chloroflexi bacterium]|nr:class I SAM-dependent methyltransferase [Chloroflexota bacterium]